MKKYTLVSWAAWLAVCGGIAACAPGQTEKALNEQAAWATSVGLERNRPQASAAISGPGGTARLVGGGLSAVPPPPLIAQLAPAPAAAAPAVTAAPPAPPAAAVATPVAAAPSAPVEVRDASPESERRAVINEVVAWRNAWTEGDLAAYIAHYDTNFKGDMASRQAWEKQRRERFAGRKMTVRIENIAVRVDGEQAQANFTQRYISNKHEDVGAKSLRLRKFSGKWLIVDEKWSRV
jgi:hypothetical protein